MLDGTDSKAWIVSFTGMRPSKFAGGNRGKAFTEFERKAEMRLDQLDAAHVAARSGLADNLLEALKDDRKEQYSIRCDQWRICFGLPKGSPGPINVEIVDYH